MAAHEFVFAIHLSGAPGMDAMLSHVAASLSQHLGYTVAVTSELVDELRAAVTRACDADRDFDVWFRAHAGQFEIRLLRQDRPLWRTARRLP